jgi:hypothetical protein
LLLGFFSLKIFLLFYGITLALVLLPYFWSKQLGWLMSIACFALGYLSWQSRLVNGRLTWLSHPDFSTYFKNQQFTYTGFGDLGFVFGDMELREASIFTDEYGHPNRSGQAQQPNKILLLGDSFTAPGVMLFDATYPQLLQTDLDLPVYNTAQPGFSPWQALLTAKQMLSQVQFAPAPIVVWQVFPGNDLIDYYGDYWELSEATFPMLAGLSAVVQDLKLGDRLQVTLPWNQGNLEHKYASKLTKATVASDTCTMYYRNSYRDQVAIPAAALDALPNMAAFTATLQKGTQFFVANGFRVLVVVVPEKSQLYPISESPVTTAIQERVAAIIDSMDNPAIRYLDVLPDLQTARTSDTPCDYLFWRDDTHLSPRGNAVVAASISAALQQQNWVP